MIAFKYLTNFYFDDLIAFSYFLTKSIIMNALKTFGLAVAAVKTIACSPAEMPSSIDIRNANTEEIRGVCKETESRTLDCVGFDADGNSIFNFFVDCDPPPSGGARYDEPNGRGNASGKPLYSLKKELSQSDGGVSCEPAGL